MEINNNFICTDTFLEICNRYYILILIYSIIYFFCSINNNILFFILNIIISNFIAFVIIDFNIYLFTYYNILYLISGLIISICYQIIFFKNKSLSFYGILNIYFLKKEKGEIKYNNLYSMENFLILLKISIIVQANFLLSYFIFGFCNDVHEHSFPDGLVITYLLTFIQWIVNYIIFSPNLNKFDITEKIEIEKLLNYNIFMKILLAFMIIIFISNFFYFTSNILRLSITFVLEIIISVIIRLIY